MTTTTTTKQRIAELRRKIRSECEKIRYLKSRPPRKNPVYEAAAIGFMPTPVDIRDSSANLRYRHMKPSLESLAEIYPCTRQRLHQIAKKWGRQILSDPEMLASVLNRTSRTPMQSALADPQQRAVMAAKLKTLS